MSESRVFLCSIFVPGLHLFIHSAVSQSYTFILLTLVHHIRLDAVKNGKRWVGHTFAFNSFSFRRVKLQLSHAEWQEGTPVTAAQLMGARFKVQQQEELRDSKVVWTQRPDLPAEVGSPLSSASLVLSLRWPHGVLLWFGRRTCIPS